MVRDYLGNLEDRISPALIEELTSAILSQNPRNAIKKIFQEHINQPYFESLKRQTIIMTTLKNIDISPSEINRYPN